MSTMTNSPKLGYFASPDHGNCVAGCILHVCMGTYVYLNKSRQLVIVNTKGRYDCRILQKRKDEHP